MRALALMFLLVVPLASCKRDNPATCSREYPGCPNGKSCDLKTYRCVEASDAGDAPRDAVDASDAGDASDAQDGPDGKPPCKGAGDCPGAVCEVDAGHCVECVQSSDCKSDAAAQICSANTCVECLTSNDCENPTPVCDAKKCVVCKSDSQCTTGPRVCMDDGHCATDGETVYVQTQNRTPACPDTGADGTASRPLCSLDAIEPRLSGKALVVLRGNVGGTLSLSVSSIAVVGQPNGAIPARILSGLGTGLTVTGGEVRVRGVTIEGTTASGDKGIVASGDAKLILTSVTVTGHDGIGVEANTGAELVMNRCIVTSNAGGGIYNSAATTTVTNTVMASNLYGIKIVSPFAATTAFNTIVSNSIATTCAATTPPSVLGSIVVGPNDSCTLDHCTTTSPTFDTARPYHLTSHLGCGTFATSVTDDIDGDGRTPPYDCGADQYMP